MNLIFIYGMPGVGKLTVARELSGLTGLPLFHNHLVVDLLLSLFEFGTPPFVELREKIWLDMFDGAADAKLPGLIFTFAFDRTVQKDLIDNVRRVVEGKGGQIKFVELTCEPGEIEKRITAQSRKNTGKLNSLELYRELKAAGAFVNPGIPTGGLKIDTTTREPRETASLIATSLQLSQVATHPEISVQAAYETWSVTYDADRNRTRDLDAEVTRKLLDDRRYKSIIEIGCGTGKNTSWLSGVAEHIVALDFSEAMIARAQAKVAEAGVSNVTFRVADVTQPWPCESATVDLVTCNLVLEHIQDIRSVFSEAARCLVNGGRLFVSELHPYRQYEGTKARFECDGSTTQIDAFTHHASEFTRVAQEQGFLLVRMEEWWHEEDDGKPPRLITFAFGKTGRSTGAETRSR